MGRRAKNKQAAPVPFIEVKASPEKPSAKKLGKRKQAPEQENRPLKKVKAKSSSKDDAKSKKSSKRETKKAEDEDEDSGWEGVQDDMDLKEEKKCALSSSPCSVYSLVCRALFADSDGEEVGFVGDLNDLDGDEDDE